MPEPAQVNDSPEAAYLARGVLDPATLDTLRQVNGAFLALLVGRRTRAAPDAPILGLEAPLAARLDALGAAGREPMARCPYSLFDLRFADAPFWRGVIADARRPTPGVLDDEATFARMAVFAAWHLAQREEFVGALVLGMTADVREAWRSMPLCCFDRAAMAALPHLAVRWAGSSRFWPDLVLAAETPGAAHAPRVRLLGLQLLAADGFRSQSGRRARARDESTRNRP